MSILPSPSKSHHVVGSENGEVLACGTSQNAPGLRGFSQPALVATVCLAFGPDNVAPYPKRAAGAMAGVGFLASLGTTLVLLQAQQRQKRQKEPRSARCDAWCRCQDLMCQGKPEGKVFQSPNFETNSVADCFEGPNVETTPVEVVVCDDSIEF